MHAHKLTLKCFPTCNTSQAANGGVNALPGPVPNQKISRGHMRLIQKMLSWGYWTAQPC